MHALICFTSLFLFCLPLDSHFVAVDKPAGISVHDGSNQQTSLLAELHESGLFQHLHLVHRLDKDTR